MGKSISISLNNTCLPACCKLWSSPDSTPAPKLTEHVAHVGAVLPADHGAALKVTILEGDAWNGGGRLTRGAAGEAK